MDKFIVMGGNQLRGEIALKAAKNTVLPLLSCCILCREDVLLKNCPKITDVHKMMDIIVRMGGRAEFIGDDIYVNCKDADCRAIDAQLTKSIRSSVFMLGPMLGRFRRAEVAYPGGCEIGKRPIDIHIAGLRSLGVGVEETPACLKCDGSGLRGGHVKLSFPSVGATENLIMAAACAEGETVIEGAALEPEIADLAAFINRMGGCVRGAGTSTIWVSGVKRLHGCEYRPVSDRIAAGTYLAMCATCGGSLELSGCEESGVKEITALLNGCGCKARIGDGRLTLISDGKLKALPLVKTAPFPGFPTDMQPQLCALLSTADGTSVVEETVFENRFKYTSQLREMGADIAVTGRQAVINGVKELYPGKVTAQDLRGGAALVTAALAADGVSIIYGVEHIDRGYCSMEKTLTDLGADIVRVSV